MAMALKTTGGTITARHARARFAAILPLALLVLACAGCRGTVGKWGIWISTMQSPLAIPKGDICKPLPLAMAEAARARPQERIDTYEDLLEKETLVVVCISGGGARSARFAAHVLAAAERYYNAARALQNRPAPPLIDAIDVLTAVSGGALYLSHVAQKCALPDEADAADAACRDTFFQDMLTDPEVTKATRDLSYRVGLQFWESFRTFFSRRTYMDTCADYLAGTYSKNVQMGDIPQQPRFFFGATCVELNAPFLITQSIMSRPGESGEEQMLPSFMRLEDIGAAPSQFPLSYAAMTSAAFPVGFDPIPITVYDKEGYALDDLKLSLADGGMFDNSGLTMAVEFAKALVTKPGSRVRRLILVEVNAANSKDLKIEKPSRARFLTRILRTVRGSATRLGMMYASYKQVRRDNALRSLFQFQRQRGAAPAYFEAPDIVDPPRLVAALRDRLGAGAPLARHLLKRFSAPTRNALNTEGPPAQEDQERLAPHLLADLNRVIRTDLALYDEARFADIRLSPSTREMIEQGPDANRLALLNRKLLVDAFPGLLRPYRDLDMLYFPIDLEQLRSLKAATVAMDLPRNLKYRQIDLPSSVVGSNGFRLTPDHPLHTSNLYSGIIEKVATGYSTTAQHDESLRFLAEALIRTPCIDPGGPADHPGWRLAPARNRDEAPRTDRIATGLSYALVRAFRDNWWDPSVVGTEIPDPPEWYAEYIKANTPAKP